MFKKIFSNNFNKLLSGTIVSSLGSYSFNFGLITYLYFASKQDKSFIAYSQLFFVIGMLSGNLLAGPIGEKLNRKKLVIFSEVIRIPIMLVMFLFVENLWVLIILHGLKTIFAGISSPVKRALITDIVEEEQLEKSNTLFTSSYAVIQIFGPFFGTWVYSVFQNINFLIFSNILALVIATLFFHLIKHEREIHKDVSKIKFVEDISKALGLIRKRFDLRALYYRLVLIGMSSGFLIVLILPFTVEELGLTEFEYGVTMVCFGMGGVAGGLLNKFVRKYLSLGKIMILTSALEPFLMLLWAAGFNYYFGLLIIFIWGTIFFLRAPAQINFISKNVSSAFVSRLNSLYDFSFTMFNILAIGIISVLGSSIKSGQFLIGLSLAYILIMIFLGPFKSTKAMYQYVDLDQKKI